MKYDFNYDPPAPSLKIRFSNPFTARSVELQTKIDSGADMTVIPTHAISELRLVPASRVSVSSFDGKEDWRYTYFVDLFFQDFSFPTVEIIDGKRHDALLGRDVLNLLKTVLDGKTLNFELHDP